MAVSHERHTSDGGNEGLYAEDCTTSRQEQRLFFSRGSVHLAEGDHAMGGHVRSTGRLRMKHTLPPTSFTHSNIPSNNRIKRQAAPFSVN